MDVILLSWLTVVLTLMGVWVYIYSSNINKVRKEFAELYRAFSLMVFWGVLSAACFGLAWFVFTCL